MKRVAITLALICLATASCNRDPLTRLKEEARKNIAKEAPDSLVAAPIEERTLTPTSGESEVIEVEGGSFKIPKPERLESIKRGKKAIYPGFSVAIDTKSKSGGLSELPAAWGANDIDKMFLICSASGKLIDDARNADELSDAVVRLTARATVAPLGHSEGVMKIEADSYRGLLCGDFKKRPGMEITLFPTATKDRAFLMAFVREGTGSREDVLKFLSGLSFVPNETP